MRAWHMPVVCIMRARSGRPGLISGFRRHLGLIDGRLFFLRVLFLFLFSSSERAGGSHQSPERQRRCGGHQSGSDEGA